MIKFNHFVRASVLSLTLAGGLALSGHAFAYDQADIDETQAAVDAAQGDVDGTVADSQSLDPDPDLTAYDDGPINEQYSAGYSSCDGWLVGLYFSEYYDCQDAWVAWHNAALQYNSDYTTHISTLNYYQDRLTMITNDQNGMHGVP